MKCGVQTEWLSERHERWSKRVVVSRKQCRHVCWHGLREREGGREIPHGPRMHGTNSTPARSNLRYWTSSGVLWILNSCDDRTLTGRSTTVAVSLPSSKTSPRPAVRALLRIPSMGNRVEEARRLALVAVSPEDQRIGRQLLLPPGLLGGHPPQAHAADQPRARHSLLLRIRQLCARG